MDMSYPKPASSFSLSLFFFMRMSYRTLFFVLNLAPRCLFREKYFAPKTRVGQTLPFFPVPS